MKPSQPREMTCTVGTEFEGLDKGCQRVELHDRSQCSFRYLTKRIDDRRGVHPKGDEDTEEVHQITVLGGKRRDDETQTECYSLQRQHNNGEEKEISVRLQVSTFEDKEQVHEDERSELDRETEES